MGPALCGLSAPALARPSLGSTYATLRSLFHSFAPTYATDLPGDVATRPARAWRRLERRTMAASAPGSHAAGSAARHRAVATAVLGAGARSPGPGQLPHVEACEQQGRGRGARGGMAMPCRNAAAARLACRHAHREQGDGAHVHNGHDPHLRCTPVARSGHCVLSLASPSCRMHATAGTSTGTDST